MSDEDDKKHEAESHDADKHPHEQEVPKKDKKPERELGEFERSDVGEEDLT